MKSLFYLAQGFILAFLLPFQLYGQTENLDDYYQKKVLEFRNVDADSVLFYNQKIATSNNQVNALMGRYAIATIKYKRGAYEETEKLLHEILVEIEKNPQPNSFTPSSLSSARNYEEGIQIVKLNVYRRFFYLKSLLGDLNQSLEYLNLRKAIVDNWPRKDNYYIKNKVAVERDLAMLNRTLENYMESIAILRAAKEDLDKLAIDSSDPYYLTLLQDKAHFYAELASNYTQLTLKDSTFADSAYHYVDLKYEATKAIKNNDDILPTQYYMDKAIIAFRKRDYLQSNKYCRDALSLYEDKQAAKGSIFFMTMNFTQLEQPDSAIKYGRKVLQQGVSTLHSKVNLYWYLAQSYEMLEQYDSAYYYSQASLANLKKLSEERTSTRKVLTEETHQKLIELNEGLAERQKRAVWKNRIFGAIAFVLLALAIVLLIRMKRKQLKSVVALQKEFERVNVENEVLRQENLENKRAITPDKNATSKEVRQLSGTLRTELLLKLHKIEEKLLFLNEDFNAHSLAKILGTNTSYLSQVIKEEKGKPFKIYLMELRINYLMEALETNLTYRKYSIEALGKMIGYTNASSFTRAFKKHMEITPSQYLKQHFGSAQ